MTVEEGRPRPVVFEDLPEEDRAVVAKFESAMQRITGRTAGRPRSAILGELFRSDFWYVLGRLRRVEAIMRKVDPDFDPRSPEREIYLLDAGGAEGADPFETVEVYDDLDDLYQALYRRGVAAETAHGIDFDTAFAVDVASADDRGRAGIEWAAGAGRGGWRVRCVTLRPGPGGTMIQAGSSIFAIDRDLLAHYLAEGLPAPPRSD